ncbi:single-stranded-DNA-specific exonuclease RecJ [cyanobiont of Ornithocercus magnificus]|nr:single-stranded-DNA-specific exonuclease RecJ [cyanobiont of Ornithocercus magnificus]
MKALEHNCAWYLPSPSGYDPLPRLPLPLALRTILYRRGWQEEAVEQELLTSTAPPQAIDHFPSLNQVVERLANACYLAEELAICGDYDADGMTSSALLRVTLESLGAKPIVAIPSRMENGYGLNTTVVKQLHKSGIRLAVTVDNGVAANEALSLAHALGIDMIVTDHHALPEQLPPMWALIHPATTPANSPYRPLAGVGLAFVLACCLAERLGQPEAVAAALDLFCIGTVADMAPLTGANRYWLQKGLAELHHSQNLGLAALQKLCGFGERKLYTEDIGFQLAPRINAVGRLGDPSLVVDLLCTSDEGEAIRIAKICDRLNQHRRELCRVIEEEAIALLEADNQGLPHFLMLTQNHWHHGVIGIVAARLSERYQLPTALLASEGNDRLRASVRAPAGFTVNIALRSCSDLLERHGGHAAAGGFTVRVEQLSQLHRRLDTIAEVWLAGRETGLVLKPEAHLQLNEVNWEFLRSMEQLGPFGPGHPVPLFWLRGCHISRQRWLRGGHLELELAQGGVRRRAIAWRWPKSRMINGVIDVVVSLTVSNWRGKRSLQLEIHDLRSHTSALELHHGEKVYHCTHYVDDAIEITNVKGDRLLLQISPDGIPKCTDRRASHPYVQELIDRVMIGFGLTA